MGSEFPVNLDIFEVGVYFVAVFGWSNGTIEELPKASEKVDITGNVTCT